MIDNYFDEGSKKKDHTKEMMNYLEKKFLNTNLEEYLKETQQQHEKCIGCAKCMSPTHKLLSYKYPKNMASRYMDFFKSSSFNAGQARAETQ